VSKELKPQSAGFQSYEGMGEYPPIVPNAMGLIYTGTHEWCNVHTSSGRGFGPNGKERCNYAALRLLAYPDSEVEDCTFVRAKVMY